MIGRPLPERSLVSSPISCTPSGASDGSELFALFRRLHMHSTQSSPATISDQQGEYDGLKEPAGTLCVLGSVTFAGRRETDLRKVLLDAA